MADEKCIIGEGIRVKGRIAGSGLVEVEGQIEGNVSLDGTFTVLEPGQVNAEVETKNLNVKGNLEGEVVASELISLEPGCKVNANLRAPRIFIAEGAKFKGHIEMDVDMSNLD